MAFHGPKMLVSAREFDGAAPCRELQAGVQHRTRILHPSQQSFQSVTLGVSVSIRCQHAFTHSQQLRRLRDPLQTPGSPIHHSESERLRTLNISYLGGSGLTAHAASELPMEVQLQAVASLAKRRTLLPSRTSLMVGLAIAA